MYTLEIYIYIYLHYINIQYNIYIYCIPHKYNTEAKFWECFSFFIIIFFLYIYRHTKKIKYFSINWPIILRDIVHHYYKIKRTILVVHFFFTILKNISIFVLGFFLNGFFYSKYFKIYLKELIN